MAGENSRRVQNIDVEGIPELASENIENKFRRTTSEKFIARRTESLDAERISELVSGHTESIFGRTDVEKIIEYANLSITLVGVESGEVLGHITLMDYPNVTAVDQGLWEEWIHMTFHCPKKTSPLNSLFVHLFVAKEGFSRGAATELLRAAFMTIPLLQFVFVTTFAGTSLGSALSPHMLPILHQSSSEGEEEGNGRGLRHSGTCRSIDLYVAHRHEHFPMLHIRPARVEDADDLMAIFIHSSTSAVTEQYGEFFLAELIASQDDQHMTIVADVDGHAVGFLSVTSVVDVELLNASYQLESFHGFRHLADQDETLSISIAGSKMSSTATLLSSLSSKAAAMGEGGWGSMEEPQEQHQIVVMSHGTTPLTGETTPSHVTTPLTGETTPSYVIDNANIVGSGHSSHCSPSPCRLEGKEEQCLYPSQISTPDCVKPTSASGWPSSPIRQDSMKKGISEEPMEPVITIVSGETETMLPRETVICSGTSSLVVMESTNIPGGDTLTSSGTAAAILKEQRKKLHMFRGTGNAIAVQLFAIDEKYEMRSLDLLPMVFQLFPDHDFLILSQPPSLPEFPLLTYFSRVLPRPSVVVTQDLYSFHKCGLLHSFSVALVTTSDLEDVVKLTSDLSGSIELVEDVHRYLQAKRDPLSEGSTPISVLVAKCYHQLVGVAVLREEEDMYYIRTHFNIEDFIYFDYHTPSSHAHLHHFILNPIFGSFTKHFIKECLRLSYKSCLYYPLYPGFVSEPSRPHSIITALSHMVPIKARRQIVYSVESLGINAPLEEVLADKPVYALYHTNRKLTYEPKINVNARVIVVGASDTAISFLETLLFSPHLHFTNLTLLSHHSFTPPTTHPASTMQRQQRHQHQQHPVTSYSMCYTKDQYTQLGLNTWINIIKGKLVALDRPEQCVSIECEDETCVVHYDYLVLCMGTQYQLPPDLGTFPVPRQANIFTVNDAHEKDYLLRWVKNKYLTKPLDNLVIYGNNLDAYAVLQAMLDCGVSPNNLVLTFPGNHSISSSPKVTSCLSNAVASAGVRVKSKVCLKGCEVDEGRLVRLHFQSEEGKQQMVVSSQALIYVDKKAVDPHAFIALNKACLVMDKKLVITTDHATNDPLIFAAGPLTKFSRRYRINEWSHANYNSREVGERLAHRMLSKLDPSVGFWKEEVQTDADADLLPSLTQPKTTGAYLPGGYHYLHFHTPVFANQQDNRRRVGTDDHDLSTDTKHGYMLLHIDQYSRVDELIALSHQPLQEASNYLCLYHIHELYLNNLVQRWQDGLIPDLYEYFRQPWACAIFHDRFSDFMKEVRADLETESLGDGVEKTMHSYVQGLVEEDQARSKVCLSEVLSLFNVSRVKKVIEKKLYRFLIYNANHLSMYVNPDHV